MNVFETVARSGPFFKIAKRPLAAEAIQYDMKRIQEISEIDNWRLIPQTWDLPN